MSLITPTQILYGYSTTGSKASCVVVSIRLDSHVHDEVLGMSWPCACHLKNLNYCPCWRGRRQPCHQAVEVGRSCLNHPHERIYSGWLGLHRPCWGNRSTRQSAKPSALRTAKLKSLHGWGFHRTCNVALKNKQSLSIRTRGYRTRREAPHRTLGKSRNMPYTYLPALQCAWVWEPHMSRHNRKPQGLISSRCQDAAVASPGLCWRHVQRSLVVAGTKYVYIYIYIYTDIHMHVSHTVLNTTICTNIVVYLHI